MKIAIDLKLCEGNERCSVIAPDVFEVGPDDKSHLLIERPNERQLEKVRLAMRICPRQAISLVEE